MLAVSKLYKPSYDPVSSQDANTMFQSSTPGFAFLTQECGCQAAPDHQRQISQDDEALRIQNFASLL